MAAYLSLFIKALLPRFLFIGHGLFSIWVAYLVERNSAWWGLSVCLFLIVAEGVHVVLVRKGKELDWYVYMQRHINEKFLCTVNYFLSLGPKLLYS